MFLPPSPATPRRWRAVDLAFEPPRGPEILEVVDVRRVSCFLREQMIDPRHDALLLLRSAEGQPPRFAGRRDRMSLEIIASVRHGDQRPRVEAVSVTAS